MGIPLLEGRFPSERDGADAPPVIVINQALGRKVWPHESAVGKRVTFDQPPKWTTVIGVVGDVKDAPNSTSAGPAYWWVEAQAPITYGMTVAVRSGSDPGTLLTEVERTVHSLDSSLAISGVRTMDQVAREAFSTPRFSMALVGLFASIALLLAAIGIYGVIAYSVSQRAHEFGLRMALGANARQVQFSVLADGIRLAAAGVALGLGSALILSSVLRSLLFEVGSTDPVTFAAVAVISIAVASMACYIPAHRATQADPMSALRCD
jgi:predicted permease